MPKENTHILIAEKVLGGIGNKKVLTIISSNHREYQLGSFFPDMFFYSFRYIYIARMLHGNRGEKTNDIVFLLLEGLKKSPSDKDLAFMFGYLCHCAADIVFHPAVFYLSGNYGDDDDENIGQVRYMHNRIETYIDKSLGHGFSANKTTSVSQLDRLQAIPKLAGMLGMEEKALKKISRKCLRRELLVNMISKSWLAYKCVRLITGLGLLKKKGELGIFYPDVMDQKILPDKFVYRHPVTGKNHSATINGLVEDSVSLSARYISAAYDFYIGKASREECEKIIPGASLESGMVGKGINEMEYFS